MTLRRGACLSPSFEGKYGYIRYSVECRLVKSKEHLLKKKPTCVEKIIEVKVPVQIEMKYLQPVTVQKETEVKVFHLCTTCTTLVTMKIELFRAGFYAYDDAIVFEVQVENESPKSINTISVGLWQYVEYRAGEHIKKDGELLREVSSEPIPSNSSVLWQPLPFYIHSLLPTLTGHSLISITYILEVSATISGALPLLAEIPLFLSSVCLPETEMSAPPLAQAPSPHLLLDQDPDKQNKSVISSDSTHVSNLSSHPYAHANFQSNSPQDSKPLI